MTDTDRLAALLHMIEDPNVGNGPSLKQKRLAANLIAAGVTLDPRPASSMFAACPVCLDKTVVRLESDWQARVNVDDQAIPIVGCGNPWHYATESVGDPRPITCPHGAEWDGTMWTKVRPAPDAALREAAAAVVSDAWYREGEEVCTLPTRNLIRLRAALEAEHA